MRRERDSLKIRFIALCVKQTSTPVDLGLAQEVSNVSFAVGAGLQALALSKRAACIVCPHLKLSDALCRLVTIIIFQNSHVVIGLNAVTSLLA